MASLSTMLMTAYVKAAPVLASGGGPNMNGVTPSSGSSNWKVDNFLDALGSNLQNWGAYIMIALGAVAIIAGAYMLVTGLISHGKKQTSWPIVIILLVVGGIMLFGGWNLFAGTIAAGLGDTAKTWGNGGGGSFILPFL